MSGLKGPVVVVRLVVVFSSAPRAVGAGPSKAAFTLVEVVVSLALVGLIFGCILNSYVTSTVRAEWSGYSLAAQSLALQGMEQARAAKWDPLAWPVVDDLRDTNLVQIEALDIAASRQIVYATNYITVTTIPGPVPMRQIRADCVWSLAGGGPAKGGPFTNTAVTLRAPDQ